MEEVSISKGDVLSLNLLSPSLLSFTSCSATSGGNGLFVSEETVEQIIYYPSWNSLFGSSYSSSLEDVYLGSPSTSTIPLQHLCFPPSEGAQTITYVSQPGNELEACGWSDLPCNTLHDALTHHSSASAVEIVQGTISRDTSPLTLPTLTIQPAKDEDDAYVTVTFVVDYILSLAGTTFTVSASTGTQTVTFNSFTIKLLCIKFYFSSFQGKTVSCIRS